MKERVTMRIGFIGGYGHAYLRGLEAEGGHEVAVAGDGFDVEAAKRSLASHPGARWYESVVSMLDGFQPELVNVGAMYGHNGDVIAQVLERGLPVVADKPIAATWEQWARLKELCAQPEARLITETPFRSQPEFRAMRQAIGDGRIGKVVLVTGLKSYRFGTRPDWYARRADYGSTILWVASHAIDIIPFVTGLRFTAVQGWHGNLSKPAYGDMEDHALTVFEMEQGALAVVQADYLRPEKAPTHGDDRIRVAGAWGVIEVRDGRCELITDDQEPLDVTGTVTVRPIHEEMLDAIQGRGSPIYGTAASLELAAILLYARDAADHRERVEIGQGSSGSQRRV
jgi:predicted dehydrogenase